MGFGNLEVNNQPDEDFLSKSSVSETDFELLMKDNFFEIVKDIQDDLESQKHLLGVFKQPDSSLTHNSVTDVGSPIQTLKMPEYDPTKNYNAEFYNLFV